MFANKLENQLVQVSDITEEVSMYSYLNDLLDVYSLNNLDIMITTSMNGLYKQEQQKQIREALMKGYVEMSHINLSICMECEHAEYEAQHKMERLVSEG